MLITVTSAQFDTQDHGLPGLHTEPWPCPQRVGVGSPSLLHERSTHRLAAEVDSGRRRLGMLYDPSAIFHGPPCTVHHALPPCVQTSR